MQFVRVFTTNLKCWYKQGWVISLFLSLRISALFLCAEVDDLISSAWGHTTHNTNTNKSNWPGSKCGFFLDPENAPQLLCLTIRKRGRNAPNEKGRLAQQLALFVFFLHYPPLGVANLWATFLKLLRASSQPFLLDFCPFSRIPAQAGTQSFFVFCHLRNEIA